MKKKILLITLILFFVGCETGVRYDKNTTKKIVIKNEAKSGLVDRDDFESLFDNEKKVEGKAYYIERVSTDSTTIEEESEIKEEPSKVVVSNVLDVRKIREGKHDGYIRLVFDVYDNSKPSKVVGHYDAKHNNSKKDISVILHGYGKFSAPLPSFPYYSVIEQIHFDQYPENSGFKFHIKLRKKAEVKIFDLKNPARIVFDIKAI